MTKVIPGKEKKSTWGKKICKWFTIELCMQIKWMAMSYIKILNKLDRIRITIKSIIAGTGK